MDQSGSFLTKIAWPFNQLRTNCKRLAQAITLDLLRV